MKIASKLVLVCIVALGAANARAADRYTIAGTASEVTVIDAVTELEWTRDVFGPLDWSDAMAKCAALTYGGKTGWRLPAVAELQTLIDYRGATGSKINAVFGNVGETYWTATPYTPASIDAWTVNATPVTLDPARAWVVDFGRGRVSNSNFGYGPQVRCVR